jgi:hypothetical protein
MAESQEMDILAVEIAARDAFPPVRGPKSPQQLLASLPKLLHNI